MSPRAFRTLMALLMVTGALAGCAEPLSMTVTPNAFDGFSYGVEGKSVSDMAISQVSDRDCALWRVIEEKPVCRDYTLKERRDMAVARLESDRHDRRGNRVNEPDLYVADKAPSPILVAQAQEAQAKLDEAEGKNAAGTAVASSGTGDRVPANPVPVPTLRPASNVRPALARASVSGNGDYLVLGSYSTREKADFARTRYAGEPTVVETVAAGGKLIYRVVSGPYEAGDLATTKLRLAQNYGVRDAWTLRSSTTTPATTQIASLPSAN